MSELHPTPAPRWAQVAPAETPSLRSLTTLAGSVVIVAALYFGREVLIPITLAILLSFVLAPLAGLLRRAIGRIPAVILSVLIAVTIFLALAGVMGVQVAELANDIPRYQTTIRQKVDTLRRFTTEPLSGLIGTVGREVQKAGKDAAEQATPAAPGDRNTAPLPVEVTTTQSFAARGRRTHHFARFESAGNHSHHPHRGSIHSVAAGRPA